MLKGNNSQIGTSFLYSCKHLASYYKKVIYKSRKIILSLVSVIPHRLIYQCITLGGVVVLPQILVKGIVHPKM